MEPKSYTKRAVVDLQKKFAIDDRYSFFLNGLSDAGLACIVVFAGYYGNNLHRPKIIGIGVCIAVAGLLCFIPQVEFDDFDPANMTVLHKSAAICTSEKKAFSQCDIVRKFESHNRFVSLLSFGQFLIGCGQTLWTILGLMFIDDNCENLNISTKYIGILIFFKYVGQFFGALLGYGFSEINENFKSGPDWIGAWWLGFVIMIPVLFLVAIPIFCFPRYLIKREWVWSGYKRTIKKKTKNKKTKTLKSKSNNAKSNKSRTLKKTTKDQNKESEEKPETDKGSDNENSVEVVNCSQQKESNEAKEEEKTEGTVVIINVENGDIFERNAFETFERRKNKTDTMKDDEEKQVHVDENFDEGGEETSQSKSKVDSESRVDQTEPMNNVKGNGYVNEGFSPESLHEGQKCNNHATESVLNETEQANTSIKKETANGREKGKKSVATKRRKRRKFKKYKLRDIFDYLLKLLKNPYWLLIITGTIIGAYTHLAYFNNLPHYLISVFMMETKLAFLLSGVVFGLGTGIGIIVGLVLTVKYLKTARRFTIYIIFTSFIIACVALILLAFRCESPKVEFYVDRGVPCYCEDVEFERICTSNRTFYSPCHAACKSIVSDGTYGNCSSSISDKILETSKCSKECRNVGGYLFFSFLMAIGCGTSYVPALSLILRTVDKKQKSLSISCAIFLAIVLGSLPGQAAYREIINSNCNHLSRDCHDYDLCLSYNTDKIVTISNLIAAGLQSLSGLFFVGLLLLLRYKKNRKKQRTSAKQDSNQNS